MPVDPDGHSFDGVRVVMLRDFHAKAIQDALLSPIKSPFTNERHITRSRLVLILKRLIALIRQVGHIGPTKQGARSALHISFFDVSCRAQEYKKVNI